MNESPWFPELHWIDLAKCCSGPRGGGAFHDHPDIREDRMYVAKIDGVFFAGRFSKQWFGWHFDDGWGEVGHQLDKPGTNASRWEALWEIVTPRS